MTTINDVLVEAKYIEDLLTTQYTSTNVTTLIDLSGGFIAAVASAASSLSLRICGRTIT